MAIVPSKVISRDLFDNFVALPLATRSPDTYQVPLEIQGNSLLSTVFIESFSAGASLEVKYTETTTGSEAGESIALPSHPLLSSGSPLSNKILVTRSHNKPTVNAIVTSGSVRFGVYITVTSSFPSDIDLALIKDGDTFVSTTNKAITVACLNDSTGKLEFLRCPLPVSVSDPGTPFDIRGSISSDPGDSVDVFSTTVPALTTRKLKRLWVTTTAEGNFSLLSGATEIAAGVLDSVSRNVAFVFDPAKSVSAGTVIKLTFTADSLPSAICPITAFLSGNDIV